MLVPIFTFLVLSSLLLMSEFKLETLDKYHNDICKVLVDSSNSIDNYFIDTNGTESSKTSAEIKSSFALETKRSSEYDMRLRLRFNLPKIQKKLRLVLEDKDTDDPLYDGTTLDSDHRLKSDNYFLRLEYFDHLIRNYHISSGVGVRFRRSNLHPYLNLKMRYIIDDSKERGSFIANRFRLYIDGDIENVFTYNFLERFWDDIYVLFHNVHRYQSWKKDRTFVNTLSMTKVYTKQQEVSLGVALNTLYNSNVIKVLYPQLYGVYRDSLYKNWIYYELNPSLLWREENDYRISARFMVNIGVIFNAD